MRDQIGRHTQEFKKLIIDNWDIESMVDSLDGAKNVAKGRVMYETVVSEILLGGLMDAFYEDQTLMPAPRRRGRTDRYFAWLVESNPEAAGKLRRELRESAGYRVVTIGTALPDVKLHPDDLRGQSTILEDADARRYRTFISLLSRDKLLPFSRAGGRSFLSSPRYSLRAATSPLRISSPGTTTPSLTVSRTRWRRSVASRLQKNCTPTP